MLTPGIMVNKLTGGGTYVQYHRTKETGCYGNR
jgi:hypothetical protein